MRKNRDSRFELLRLIAIGGIVLSHFTSHTAGTVLPTDGLTLNRALGYLFLCGGKLGVNLFLLITGYFQCRKPFRTEKFLRLEGEVLFYSLLFLGINALLCLRGKAELPLKRVLAGLMPTLFTAYYFSTPYMGVYLLSPFLNRLTGKGKNGSVLVALLAVMVSLIPTFTLQTGWASTLLMFVFVYLLGAWIASNEEEILRRISKRGALLGFALCLLFTWVVSQFLLTAGRRFPSLTSLAGGFCCTEYSLPLLLAAAFLMVAALNGKPFVSQLINRAAGHTYGVYLIQSSNLMANILLWPSLSRLNLYSSRWWPLVALGITLAVVLTGMAVDALRAFLFRCVKLKRLQPFFVRVDEIMNR